MPKELSEQLSIPSLGAGYDFRSDEFRPMIIDIDQNEIITDETSAQETVVKMVSTQEEMTDSLEASGSLDISFKMLKGNVNGSYNAIKGSNSDELDFMIMQSYETQVQRIEVMKSVKLLELFEERKKKWKIDLETGDAAAKEKVVSGLKGIIDSYGTHVCTAVVYGAHQRVHLKMTMGSSSDKTTIAGSLTATLDTASFSGKLTGNVDKLDASSKSRLEISFQHVKKGFVEPATIKFEAKGTPGVGPFLEATKTALEWSQAKNADGTGTVVAAADAETKRYKGILINGGIGDVLRCEVTSLAYIFQDLLFLMEDLPVWPSVKATMNLSLSRVIAMAAQYARLQGVSQDLATMQQSLRSTTDSSRDDVFKNATPFLVPGIFSLSPGMDPTLEPLLVNFGLAAWRRYGSPNFKHPATGVDSTIFEMAAVMDTVRAQLQQGLGMSREQSELFQKLNVDHDRLTGNFERGQFSGFAKVADDSKKGRDEDDPNAMLNFSFGGGKEPFPMWLGTLWFEGDKWMVAGANELKPQANDKYIGSVDSEGQPHGYGKLVQGGTLLFEGIFWHGRILDAFDEKIDERYRKQYIVHNMALASVPYAAALERQANGDATRSITERKIDVIVNRLGDEAPSTLQVKLRTTWIAPLAQGWWDRYIGLGTPEKQAPPITPLPSVPAVTIINGQPLPGAPFSATS